MSDKYVIGVDCGIDSVRCIIVDARKWARGILFTISISKMERKFRFMLIVSKDIIQRVNF